MGGSTDREVVAHPGDGFSSDHPLSDNNETSGDDVPSRPATSGKAQSPTKRKRLEGVVDDGDENSKSSRLSDLRLRRFLLRLREYRKAMKETSESLIRSFKTAEAFSEDLSKGDITAKLAARDDCTLNKMTKHRIEMNEVHKDLMAYVDSITTDTESLKASMKGEEDFDPATKDRVLGLVAANDELLKAMGEQREFMNLGHKIFLAKFDVLEASTEALKVATSNGDLNLESPITRRNLLQRLVSRNDTLSLLRPLVARNKDLSKVVIDRDSDEILEANAEALRLAMNGEVQLTRRDLLHRLVDVHEDLQEETNKHRAYLISNRDFLRSTAERIVLSVTECISSISGC